MGSLQFLFLLSTLLLLTTSHPKKQNLKTSCTDLEDGIHYIQILSNDELSSFLSEISIAPIVRVRCYSGYTIINPSFDSSWISYFTSYHNYNIDYSGPDLEDRVTWREWFIPSKLNENNDYKYAISPDCNQCILDDNEYNNRVYYMSGDTFACYWPAFSVTNDNIDQCIIDINGYTSCPMCPSMQPEANGKLYYSAKCGTMIYDPDSEVITDHHQCMETQDNNKLPSIGTNNEYCVCYQPSETSELKAANWDYRTDTNDEEAPQAQEQEQEEEADDSEENIIELYQSDFTHGTYRIFESGTYRIMEDIKFNFNSGNINEPNAPTAWVPYESQEDIYPGAASSNWDDYYSWGFFAGITVESDDVIIDLNGHSIGMDYKFYLQQRWFICISLTNKGFTDGGGIAFLGIGQKSSNNVIIRNGVIGLSSHIGIFGINSNNIHLLNIHVRDFETHGVALDEFSQFTIKNVEIGPSVNGQLKIHGRYTSARLMLPILYGAVKECGEKTISFNNGKRGPYTMKDIVDRLVNRMDIAFEYAINGLESDNINTDSIEYREAKSLFIVEDGISQYSTIYGLVLRPKGAGVFDYGTYYGTGDSTNALIQDLYIHDLIINPTEIIKIGISADMWLRNSFNAPIDLSIAIQNPKFDDNTHINDAIYYGDVFTDSLIALRELSESWWLLARMIIWPEFVDWAMSGDTQLFEHYDNNRDVIKQICGYDVVSHVSKGVIGLKIEYSQNIVINNIRIENLINMGGFGHSNCDYYVLDSNYQGNHARGISIYNGDYIDIDGLNIQNIVSFYGPSYGIYVDQPDADSDSVVADHDSSESDDSEISFNDDDHVFDLGFTSSSPLFSIKNAEFTHIDAGIKGLYDGIDISNNIGYNWAAESCAIYIDGILSNIENVDDFNHNNIQQQCMNGHTYCTTQGIIIRQQCNIDAEYITPLGTFYIAKNGDIDAQLVHKSNTQIANAIIYKSYYFSIGIVLVLIILGVAKCIYSKIQRNRNSMDKYLSKYNNNNNEQRESLLNNENADVDYNSIS